ncbi:DUF3267 domain-containing protein [Salinicoccus sesuvii]|uniref:DUF3267 domain-containing protein n=1 Tax=Salinicoccus sesuvii TaxID=868281 RepID=A0ABV7N4F9_9STAP
MGGKYVFNIFEDEVAMRRLNILASIITLPAFFLFLMIDVLSTQNINSVLVGMEQLGIIGAILMIMAIMFAVITVHEAIHGIFFKIFAPNGQVKFGYKAGLFYATAPGSIFTKKQFSVIILMPFVLITVMLIVLVFTVPHGIYKYLLALHTGACAGDFYFVYLLYKYRNMEYVEDTDVGMTLYEKYPESR